MSNITEFQLRLALNVHESGWKMYLLISPEVLISILSHLRQYLCSFILSQMKWSKTTNTNYTELSILLILIFSFCGWKLFKNLSLWHFIALNMELYTVTMNAESTSATNFYMNFEHLTFGQWIKKTL